MVLTILLAAWHKQAHPALPPAGEADSVGIDLKELGGQLPKCLKFCPGIEIWSRFSLKNERL